VKKPPEEVQRGPGALPRESFEKNKIVLTHLSIKNLTLEMEYSA
jgi:hypothetical protein